MRPNSFFVLILLVFFMMAFVACDESTVSESGIASGEEVDSGDTAGGAGNETVSSDRWTPRVGDTWQWQLQGSLDTGYDVTAYDIDLFDNPAATIQQLHDDGRRVVCYFSAGSYEDWRPDAGDFTSADLGNALDGWPGERWLDIRSASVRNIMEARLDLAAQKGCDAVEPDNVDGYTNGTGFPLSAADQLDYNRFLARQAHQRNLAVALKNDVGQAADLAADFDFAINEECHTYDECDTLNVFIEAGKPVFNAEYGSQYVNDPSARESLCEDALARSFSTLVLPLDLDDSFRYSCGAPDAGSTDTGDEGSDDTAAVCSGPWYQANLTWYESYPDPDSEECIEYNGCTWAGQFYGLEGTQTEEWVAAHNIVSVHQKDWDWLGMQNIKLRQGDHEIIATVYDLCSDSDCDGCCTQNLGPVNSDGNRYLIDIEAYTRERFGSGEGIVEFQMCGGEASSDTEDDADSNDIEGALLGLYYGDESIEATSQKLQRTVPLHLTYYDFDHDWTGSVTQNDIQAGRIPLVNWEIFSATLDDIIGGAYDTLLAKRARDAKALGAQIYVDFGAEMNGDWSPWGGAQNGNSADKYVAAYRHVHDALAEADNITWLWCPNVTDEPREAWNAAMNYYPGDEYVDWTCVDGYNWGNAGGAGWQSFEEIFKDIYPQLAAKNKPVMIGEMASAESGGSKTEFIGGIIPTLKGKFPLIKGLVWFDINKETDWRISSSPGSEAAFITMAADPYFNPN